MKYWILVIMGFLLIGAFVLLSLRNNAIQKADIESQGALILERHAAEKTDLCKLDARYWASKAIVCGRDVEELSAEEVKRCKTLNAELDSLDAYLKLNNCEIFIKGDVK